MAGERFDDEVTDNPFQNNLMGFIDPVDTMTLGANTYNQTRTTGPNADDQGKYGEKLNSLAKVVASSTLDDSPWGDFPVATVTGDPVATVQELKREPGKILWLWGSLQLMNSLLAAGHLELLEATAFDNGVALLRYALKN